MLIGDVKICIEYDVKLNKKSKQNSAAIHHGAEIMRQHEFLFYFMGKNQLAPCVLVLLRLQYSFR